MAERARPSAFAAGAAGPAGLSPAAAPPLSLPMRHFASAAAALWIFSAAFAWAAFGDRLLGFSFDARWALGLVHTLTLGWIATTLFGAMLQLAPVLWEASLPAQGLAKAAWALFTAAWTGFVACLWSGAGFYWAPAAAAAGAVLLYLWVLGRTMASARRLDWTGLHLAASSCCLLLLAALGLLLAWDRHQGRLFSDPEGVLIAHVHLALVGWVSLSIIGVSYRLVSMFSLSHIESKTPGRLALLLVSAGLLGLCADALLRRHRSLAPWACVLAAGYLAYAFQMGGIFRERNRRIDPALAYNLAALAGGLLWAALGLGLAFGVLEDTTEARAAYLCSALLAWAVPFILGQIHKIVPFLVWLHVYSKGGSPLRPLPKVQDLASERLAWAELALYVPGAWAAVAGFLLSCGPALRAGSALLLAASTLYAANFAFSLSHVLAEEFRCKTSNAISCRP